MRDIAFGTPSTSSVYALHGAPVSGTVPAGGHQGMSLSDSTAPYVGRGNKCMGNDDTCGARRVRGEKYCAGHLRSIRKKDAATAPVPAPVVEVGDE